MIIVTLEVSTGESGIHYNGTDDLGLNERPVNTKAGGVVRGLGTHFSDAAAAERYTRLVSESNSIREAFKRRFVKAPLKSTFVASRVGEAKEYVDSLKPSPEIIVKINEWYFTAAGEFDLAEWAQRVKDQLMRLPFGQKKSEIDKTGITALGELAKCPALAKETADRLSELLAQVEIGAVNKTELKRNIELLDVKMDAEVLNPRRGLEV